MSASITTPYSFVASDMDGTLLSPAHVISPLTKNTLTTLLLDKHVTFILATGRNHFDVHVVSDHLQRYVVDQARLRYEKEEGGDLTAPVTELPLYLITSNGAVIHNATTNQMVSQRCVDPVVAEKLYRLLSVDEKDINTHVYQYDDWYCRLDWKEAEDIHKESGMRYKLCANAPLATTSDRADGDVVDSGNQSSHDHQRKGVRDGCFEGVTKVFFLIRDPAQMERASRLVREAVEGFGVSLTSSAWNSVDVMGDGVTKGSAMEIVLRMIDTTGQKDAVAQSLQRTIAFGDGLNDKEMLQAVGKGCVMQNANPLLKEQCPQLEVIASNAKDGVARKLCEVFGLETDGSNYESD